jgi:hypothetical protein
LNSVSCSLVKARLGMVRAWKSPRRTNIYLLFSVHFLNADQFKLDDATAEFTFIPLLSAFSETSETNKPGLLFTSMLRRRNEAIGRKTKHTVKKIAKLLGGGSRNQQATAIINNVI